MKNYLILTPVEHDHTRFEPGATISLEDAAAAPLLALAAIDGPIDEPIEEQAKAGK